MNEQITKLPDGVALRPTSKEVARIIADHSIQGIAPQDLAARFGDGPWIGTGGTLIKDIVTCIGILAGLKRRGIDIASASTRRKVAKAQREYLAGPQEFVEYSDLYRDSEPDAEKTKSPKTHGVDVDDPKIGRLAELADEIAKHSDGGLDAVRMIAAIGIAIRSNSRELYSHGDRALFKEIADEAGRAYRAFVELIDKARDAQARGYTNQW